MTIETEGVEEEREATSEENIQSAIDEALNAKEDEIEDDTINEETGELNVSASEEGEDDNKTTETKPEDKDKQQEAAKSDSEEVEEDVTGQNLVVKDGNLVNPVSGKVVANAGRERRFYEQRELARKQIVETRSEVETLRSEIEAAKQRATVFEDAAKATYGVDPAEIKVGVDLVKGFQADPTGTLKKLLAEALSKGYTIEGISTGMDTLIAERLRQDNVTTQEADPEQEAAQEVETFYGRRPDAKLHDGLIAQFVNANPKISLDDAYYALRDSFVARGLDWNTPLDQQLQNKETPQAQQQQQKPMPNGSGDVANSNVVPVNKQSSSSANQSLDDIVRESMKEQGLG